MEFLEKLRAINNAISAEDILTEEYTNKESQEIEDFLNNARKRLISEGLPETALLPAKVVFVRPKK